MDEEQLRDALKKCQKREQDRDDKAFEVAQKTASQPSADERPSLARRITPNAMAVESIRQLQIRNAELEAHLAALQQENAELKKKLGLPK